MIEEYLKLAKEAKERADKATELGISNPSAYFEVTRPIEYDIPALCQAVEVLAKALECTFHAEYWIEKAKKELKE